MSDEAMNGEPTPEQRIEELEGALITAEERIEELEEELGERAAKIEELERVSVCFEREVSGPSILMDEIPAFDSETIIKHIKDRNWMALTELIKGK